MPFKFDDFSISGIFRIHADPDIYMGDVTFRFLETIGGEEYGNSVDVRVRIQHSSLESVQSLEQAMLAAATQLLKNVASSLKGLNVTELRVAANEKRETFD